MIFCTYQKSHMFIAALYVNNLNVVTWLKKLRYRYIIEWFPRWFSGKESVCNSGNVSSVSGLGRSPGEGNGSPFQYSCLENSKDRGAWQATVHGVTESDTIYRPNTATIEYCSATKKTEADFCLQSPQLTRNQLALQLKATVK